VIRLTRRNDGVYEPEMRLLDAFYYACFLPITFFWYGWTAQYKVHVRLCPLPSLFSLILCCPMCSSARDNVY
jgi:hypothetical protein